MIPEPFQLNLFDTTANEPALLQPVANCAEPSNEIQIRSPTDDEQGYYTRNLDKSIEHAHSLLCKSRELVKKSWEKKIQQQNQIPQPNETIRRDEFTRPGDYQGGI